MGEKKETKKIVFYISLIIIAVMAVWSVAFNDSFTAVSNAAFAFFTTDFGWLYLLAMIVFLVFIVFIAFSKFGKIRLGGDDSKPEYSNMTWFGLLFGCGMGVGLVFWGVAEPLNHYLNPQGMEGATAESADFAMKSFFTHWGILPGRIMPLSGLRWPILCSAKIKRDL